MSKTQPPDDERIRALLAPTRQTTNPLAFLLGVVALSLLTGASVALARWSYQLVWGVIGG